jgi:hypothetical protein
MGYFDGLANGSFKKDAAGRDLVFIGGIFGKGRVLPDAETAAALRARFINFYKLLMFGGIPIMIVLVNLPGGIPIVVAAAAVLSIGTWFYFRRLVRDLPVAEERLSSREAYRNAARGHSYLGLVMLTLIGLAFVAVGSFLLSVDETEARWAGLACVLFFGACTGLFVWMIILKKRTPPAEPEVSPQFRDDPPLRRDKPS